MGVIGAGIRTSAEARAEVPPPEAWQERGQAPAVLGTEPLRFQTRRKEEKAPSPCRDEQTSIALAELGSLLDRLALDQPDPTELHCRQFARGDQIADALLLDREERGGLCRREVVPLRGDVINHSVYDTVDDMYVN
jgi:hypothetical protein